jgi:hypothetical protein
MCNKILYCKRVIEQAGREKPRETFLYMQYAIADIARSTLFGPHSQVLGDSKSRFRVSDR